MIPAYNEEKGITKVVREFRQKYVDEVIVVDDADHLRRLLRQLPTMAD